MYIASLAVADFLVGALIPWKIALTYAGNEVTRESKTMECLALNCCFFTLMIASMLTITAISVDRLLNVRLNLYYPVYITPKPARCVIVALWVVAFAVGAAPVLSSIHNVPVTYLRCHVYFMQHEYRLYQVYVQGGIFSFCSLVSFLCYGYIVLVAFRHKRAIAKIAPAPRLGSFHAKAAITKTGEFRQDAHQDPCKGECKGKGHSSAGGSSKAHGLTKNDRKDLTDEPGSVDSVTVLKVNSQARFVRAADAASCSSGISTRPFVGDVADTSTHSAGKSPAT
nr:hypothetical protein BaRGS_003878 [Batillaria attramentaria]